MTDVTQTPEFQRWFAGSKIIDQNGRPLVLYRGIHGPHVETDSMHPRSGYAMFFTTNPWVAATYSGPLDQHSMFHEMPDNRGAIFPVFVRCLKLHEFPTKMNGDYKSFDMFAFDDQARRLGPDEGMVVRGIGDAGPRGSLAIDPEHRYSYRSDTYSFGPGTSIKSAVGAQRFDRENSHMTEHIINKVRGIKMTKTFLEMLAEKDDEFTYFVRSATNIHNPEIFERLRLAWLPYVIKSFDADSYKPMTKHNQNFPDEPNSPTYSIKVVTGLPIPKKFIETMAMDARIHISHLKIDPEGDLELVNEPAEVPSSDAQKLVGQKRIGEFIKELQDDRKKRDEMSSTKEVYESFFTTHRALEGVLKKPLRNGYYMVEAYREDHKTYLRAEGPFVSRPEGGNYRDRIRATAIETINEANDGSMYGVQVQISANEFDNKNIR